MITLIGIILFLASYYVIWCFGKNYGINYSNKVKEYDMMYSKIRSAIYHDHKCRWDYDLINSKLIELSKLRHKDRERTNVLWNNFLIEWEKVK